MGAPACFQPSIQANENNCAVAALAMLLGEEYVKVLKVAEELGYASLRDGLTSIQMGRIARKLKQPLTNTAVKALPEDKVGILMVRRGNDYHAVMLFHDVICDPSDSVVWEADTYLKVSRYKPFRFLEP